MAPDWAENAYIALQRIETATIGLPERERASAIEDGYRIRFGSVASTRANARATDDRTLPFVFEATYLALFYARDPDLYRRLRLIGDEMENRQLANDEHRASIYKSMIGLRRFDDARSYLERHPTLNVDPPPTIETLQGGGIGPVVYSAQTAHRMKEVPVDLDRETRLIATAHPLCGFSRSAMEAAAADASISWVLPQVLWLAPPDQTLDLEQVVAWNREHPTTQVVISRAKSDWPMIDRWATPTFYLIDNGEVVDSFSGWPRGEDNLSRLRELIDPLLSGREQVD
ncbi:hypothetical protein H0E84_08765 [Luteimonas sp. SJ-92]|uniref:Thioredoxin domain-containing protein n=1 Tax=Luteimonas salinisoli TaxID=2752307 RepID=A0A853JCX4_9GAMM|nr:hypothetical protein [Luteimonas salinisoli]NZA26477.1 hypothetical protein [Luteimonas salinisoli]